MSKPLFDANDFKSLIERVTENDALDWAEVLDLETYQDIRAFPSELLLIALEAMQPILKYYEDTEIEHQGCDLSVDFHSPECCIQRSLKKALNDILSKLEEAAK